MEAKDGKKEEISQKINRHFREEICKVCLYLLQYLALGRAGSLSQNESVHC